MNGKKSIVQWFKNGDHPLDYAEDRIGLSDGRETTFSKEECQANDWEGAVVRRYRNPSVEGSLRCKMCGHVMNDHGWLDLKGNTDTTVCPGDFVVTDPHGELFVVHEAP